LPVVTLQLPAQRCSICNETFGQPRADGSVEKAAILPCAHIFGELCISRWLENSPHHDCPNCRRKMVYSGCGHVIKACDIERAPKSVGESEMPEKCLACCWGGMMEEELRIMNERRLLEERALAGMKLCLPGIFGGRSRETVESADGRIEEVRRSWRAELDAAISKFEDNEGRHRW